jgi:hypothetical protein
LQREQANVLAFADPRRELEESPEGLETGFVKRRKRGARTDNDCINEICELVAQGITATAASRYVGVPWAMWQSWLKKNHEQAREKFDFSYGSHLEVMADATLRRRHGTSGLSSTTSKRARNMSLHTLVTSR